MPQPTMTDTDVAYLLLDLRLWGAGCADKLMRLWSWAADEGDKP